MDIEFEKVEKIVVYEVNRAIDILLHAEQEFKGSAGLVAGREGNVLELTSRCLDVFASLAEICISNRVKYTSYHHSHCPI